MFYVGAYRENNGIKILIDKTRKQFEKLEEANVYSLELKKFYKLVYIWHFHN